MILGVVLGVLLGPVPILALGIYMDRVDRREHRRRMGA